MAYGDDYVERRGGLSLGGKIAIALAALIGLPIIAAFAYGVYSTVLVSPETKLARAIDNSPEAKGFYAGLKRNYPQEYAALNAPGSAPAGHVDPPGAKPHGHGSKPPPETENDQHPDGHPH